MTDKIPFEMERVVAHKHSSNHRDEILASQVCGCFYCLAIFAPETIKEWIDEKEGVAMTALCPECGIDSVIGSSSGFPITKEFLQTMYRKWFL